ncbi:ParB family chromosome partitioning protein [Rhizobium skierniewicense]|uniref:ParB family chromosome partitioning protein n=1 Tax=Rhizobium skierniewicense TaxID=984260 RepID=A0A7W6CA12_9HYPH|nr:ParB/RepB/Spo0J family partition protein [Rhizobium skierniewicense]MBB3948428.1 ParB family chromosome partitioning protein [Rhizobium skierniewicense]
MSSKNTFEGLDFSGFDTLTALDTKKDQDKEPAAGHKEIALDMVIEDPDQPRRSFDADALQELADSISKRGVLQAIVVRPKNKHGKHVIVMGARRYRASLLAKRKTIPVIIRVEGSDGYDQMVENIQREALSHHDIALFVSNELAKGVKPAVIAAGLGKPRAWVSLYVDFFDMAPAIQERSESFGIRAAYELHKAYGLNADATEAYVASRETITQREAIEFAKSLKSESSSPLTSLSTDIAEDKVEVGEAQSAAITEQQPVKRDQSQENSSPRLRGSVAHAVVVKVGDSFGRLLLDKPAEQGSKFGTVSFDNGSTIKEVALSDLEIFEIIRVD